MSNITIYKPISLKIYTTKNGKIETKLCNSSKTLPKKVDLAYEYVQAVKYLSNLFVVAMVHMYAQKIWKKKRIKPTNATDCPFYLSMDFNINKTAWIIK